MQHPGHGGHKDNCLHAMRVFRARGLLFMQSLQPKYALRALRLEAALAI